MGDIEQLKQDNVKLQERLNNAAKFFREQKAQIENLTKDLKEANDKLETKTKEYDELLENSQKMSSDNNNCYDELKELKSELDKLTKENDELKHDAESFNSLQESYENTIKSKDQAFKTLQDTYDEVFAENKKLTEDIKEQTKFESDVINTKVPELEEKLKNSEAAYDELHKKYAAIKVLHDGDLNRYNELEDNYEKLQNKFKENDIAKGEAELRLENIQTEYTKKFEEQKNAIESKDKAYKLLQNTYNEVFGELNELKETNKKNVNAYEDLMHDFKVEEEKHKKDIELKEKFAEACDELNKSNVELKDKVDKLNKLYDSCENEKLAVQADYEALKEKYNELKINAEAYEETAREYEEIYEDYEKYKNFINALFTKAEEVNITWKKPEDQPKTDNIKKQNKEDNDDGSKVTVELNKQTNTKKEERIINQEMNIQGNMNFNI